MTKKKKLSESSKNWLKRQHADIHTQKAKKEGFRCRAAYKLIEISEKDNLFKPGMTVVDLGAAPGGWAQVTRQKIGEEGRLVAIDILPLEPLQGVDIIQGDIEDESVFDALVNRLGHVGDKPVDLVLSDMAPNLSGLAAIDQPRAFNLAEMALAFTHSVLKEGGHFVVKVFQGSGFQEYVKMLKGHFDQVSVRKPKASRKESREIYLVAKSFTGAVS